ncbi:MAG: MipA/OmpV family protein [Thalassotalea sp.]|nr:MipA/OmpV family protein [Thalassotalea sp.]
MKSFLAFAIMVISFKIFATAKIESNEALVVDQSKSFSYQWGIDALDIPKYLSNNSAESLGLILPEQNALSYANIELTNENNDWLSASKTKNNYRLSTVINTSTHSNSTGLNVAYSNGRFSAETGVVSNSNNLLSSGKVYLQGAYSIFDNQQLNISLTAKVEALDENNVKSYFGESILTNNISIFEEHHATNTTLGIVSTYSINKQWKVLGMISSTTLDDKIESSPLIDDNNLHMALIGTSYAF